MFPAAAAAVFGRHNVDIQKRLDIDCAIPNRLPAARRFSAIACVSTICSMLRVAFMTALGV